MRQGIALLDELPFGEKNLLQGTDDLCAYGHRRQRRDRAERRDFHVDITRHGLSHGHGHGTILSRAPTRIGRRLLVAQIQKKDRHQGRQEQHDQQRFPMPS